MHLHTDAPIRVNALAVRHKLYNWASLFAKHGRQHAKHGSMAQQCKARNAQQHGAASDTHRLRRAAYADHSLTPARGSFATACSSYHRV